MNSQGGFTLIGALLGATLGVLALTANISLISFISARYQNLKLRNEINALDEQVRTELNLKMADFTKTLIENNCEVENGTFANVADASFKVDKNSPIQYQVLTNVFPSANITERCFQPGTFSQKVTQTSNADLRNDSTYYFCLQINQDPAIQSEVTKAISVLGPVYVEVIYTQRNIEDFNTPLTCRDLAGVESKLIGELTYTIYWSGQVGRERVNFSRMRSSLFSG